jgi:hypothetical protein
VKILEEYKKKLKQLFYMKILNPILFLLFTLFCMNFGFSQYSEQKCLGLAAKLEKNAEDLSPAESIERELYNTCVGIRDLLLEHGTPTNWNVVGPALQKMIKIVDNAKKGVCSGADCKSAQKCRNKIEKECNRQE